MKLMLECYVRANYERNLRIPESESSSKSFSESLSSSSLEVKVIIELVESENRIIQDVNYSVEKEKMYCEVLATQSSGN